MSAPDQDKQFPSDKEDFVPALPADVPIQYLYFRNGLHHYASVCCPIQNHSGLVLSTYDNLETDCTNPTPIQGTELDPPSFLESQSEAGVVDPKSIILDLRLGNKTENHFDAAGQNERVVGFSYEEEDESVKEYPTRDVIDNYLRHKTFVMRPEKATKRLLRYQHASEIPHVDEKDVILIRKAKKPVMPDGVAAPVFWLKTSEKRPKWIIVTTV